MAPPKEDSQIMDLRLIPEFDGVSQPVEEWLEKLELVCSLRGITELHAVVPLRLVAGAFSVYQQLDSKVKMDFKQIKAALIAAFAVDKFIAYDQFVTRRLRDGESVDVYLADLRRLAALFGGIPDAGLGCAFVAGLPASVSRILRAGSRLENLNITDFEPSSCCPGRRRNRRRSNSTLQQIKSTMVHSSPAGGGRGGVPKV